eukprot:142856-Hanusia_phi.AAC.1
MAGHGILEHVQRSLVQLHSAVESLVNIMLESDAVIALHQRVSLQRLPQACPFRLPFIGLEPAERQRVIRVGLLRVFIRADLVRPERDRLVVLVSLAPLVCFDQSRTDKQAQKQLCLPAKLADSHPPVCSRHSEMLHIV